jgi:NTP-dependent ternary system trypsin peptidase co-occuring protein
MAELLRYEVDEITTIAVEVDDDRPGFESASPRDIPARAAEKFSDILASGRRAAEIAFEQFRDMAVKPDEIGMEIGLKITAEAGAVIAKTSSEGHIVLKLVWRPASE